MKPHNLLDAPKDISHTLITELSQWKMEDYINTKNVERVRELTKMHFCKELLLYWSGDTKDIYKPIAEALEWISEQYLPEQLNFMGVEPGVRCFPNENHEGLAQDVFNEAWNLYLNTPRLDFPWLNPKKERNWLQILIGWK